MMRGRTIFHWLGHHGSVFAGALFLHCDYVVCEAKLKLQWENLKFRSLCRTIHTEIVIKTRERMFSMPGETLSNAWRVSEYEMTKRFLHS